MQCRPDCVIQSLREYRKKVWDKKRFRDREIRRGLPTLELFGGGYRESGHGGVDAVAVGAHGLLILANFLGAHRSFGATGKDDRGECGD